MSDKLKTAVINMWGQEVAAVTWLEQGYAVFEYTEAFQRSALNISPIMMPINSLTKTLTSENAKSDMRYMFSDLSKESFMGLPGLLTDSLPGKFGSSMVDEWRARQGLSHEALNPIEQLCCLGNRSMGALEFIPSTVSATNKNQNDFQKEIPLEIDQLVNFLQTVTQDRGQMQLSLSDDDDQANEDALSDILRVGISAGGAQAKAVIAINETSGHILSGQADIPDDYDYWLLKFDGVDNGLGQPSNQTRIEYAYALMARAAGIDISECRLLEENERAHFITRRFDRLRNSSKALNEKPNRYNNQDNEAESKQDNVVPVKLHMQSLHALAHYDFNKVGVYSYEQAFAIMREMRLPKSAALEQYKRMLFNVFARNQNDHTKNIVFLMNEKGQWKLSPAFNLTYSYDATGTRMSQHQMSINSKRDNFTRKDLITIGESISLPKPERVIDEVKQAVSQWPTFAKRAGLKKKIINDIVKMHRLDI